MAGAVFGGQVTAYVNKWGWGLLRPPGRALGPVAHRVGSPRRRFVHVAGGAGVGDFVLVRHGRGDDREGVRAHEDIGDSDLDLRHVARHTFTARGAVFMVRMRGKRRRAGSVPRFRAVAIQAYLIHGLSQLRIVLRAMDIMAVEARDP